MQFYSPLRYPGGKNRLSKFITSICQENNIDGHYVEPYAGGASVALHLLFNGYVREITINDYDRAIYAFWYSIINDTKRLCRKIKNTQITLENWHKQKNIQKNKDNENNLLKLGFSTFFLNRTNYSGIIDGGMIGGSSQEGEYKIDCRFNKEELIDRIRFIAIHKKHIHVKNMDALDLLRKIEKTKDTIFYFDPPYYLKGPSLYMNHYNHEDHERVSKEIKKIKNAKWIVSYDNTPEIKKMYSRCNKTEYEIFHTAYNARVGKEILLFSKNLTIPNVTSLKSI
ncbi:MAG: DNA adenine methylase [bacterium]|nr:DNA adenine methylase [bacterium]